MCSDKNRFVCASNVFKKPLFLLLRTKMLVVLVLVSLCGCSSGHQEQKFAMEPQDQTAVVGSRVTLPCRVEHKSGQLQWTKDDFGLGLQRDLSGYERYRMIGSDEEGDYSLDIRDVTLDDDAKYQCQVSSGPRATKPHEELPTHYMKLHEALSFQCTSAELHKARSFQCTTTELHEARSFQCTSAELHKARSFQCTTTELHEARSFQCTTTELHEARSFQCTTTELHEARSFQCTTTELHEARSFQCTTTELHEARSFQCTSTELHEARSFQFTVAKGVEFPGSFRTLSIGQLGLPSKIIFILN
ncbi:hypothetical protein JYU34_022194 [Plutella xylostella]|uniref:Ig-like domain-containing protein n=1 Tax=Plutella xylostella TaxID=51655 RepID=A0ABQ7PQG4_PLUXY|nr:hypothetical protein JYU34_022194 [Plutella xylostella]